MSLFEWTGPHDIQHGGQSRKFFKKAMLSDSGRVHSVPDSETEQKLARPCPRNVGEFVPSLGRVHGACRSPAIFPRLLNGSQPNFPGKRQTVNGR